MPKIPKWLKKSFVTLVTVVTLGTVVPSINYHTEQRPSSKESFNGASATPQRSELAVDIPTVDHVEKETNKGWPDIANDYDTVDELLPHFQSYALEEAKAQGFLKFGDTITQQIGETYTKDILPKFADVVADLGKDTDVDTLKNIAISNNPAGGTGERILNLYDGRDGKELLKFHVRRDHPPLEGYWFNFHYHTYEDHYQAHHELGKVYWNKNTPPQWQA
ncbi:cell division protein FtsK [Pullulanibacillus camelliae]|uniref:Cell division protein FtsK n=1 Tax=Pullulanibacillus camelliae TaxID=1707096 RepID=A0A8J2VSQ7_9BACL|nr:YpjP family protein [Pullulanibacillus camelliae]GGE37444.1 cell division protein FtsK [Pullulanibacillus camelliae]